MKKCFFILAVIILQPFEMESQNIQFYSNLNLTGVVYDESGQEHQLSNLTYVKKDYKFGGVVKGYLAVKNISGKFGDSKVEIPIKKIKSIIFEKEQKSPESIDFYAIIEIKSGDSRRLLIKNVYMKGPNQPPYAFAGVSGFGEEVIDLWKIKRITFTSLNAAGDPVKVR
jgi:hypothetical protein